MASIGCVGVNFSFQLIYQHLYFMLQWVSGVDKNKQNLLYFYGLRRVQIINIKKTVKFIDFPQCIKMFNRNFSLVLSYSTFIVLHFLIYFFLTGNADIKKSIYDVYNHPCTHLICYYFPTKYKPQSVTFVTRE